MSKKLSNNANTIVFWGGNVVFGHFLLRDPPNGANY